MTVPADILRAEQDLPDEGLRELLTSGDPALRERLRANAREVQEANFGRKVWLRALIEWTNACRNDCLYCGIRRSNGRIRRYTLTREEILSCCERAWNLGLRSFVLQGGENPAAVQNVLVGTVAEIRSAWPDATISLSVGELPRETYTLLKRSGADRFLLRHETASPAHYARLHPAGMTLEHRLQCLRDLRDAGFLIGMGMMVGSPFQTLDDLVRDIRLIQEFQPGMIGLGPFVPQKDTPLGGYPAGSTDLTLRLYSILRLMHPKAYIPSTTALSTLMDGGRMAGILSGANVIMPNFTPEPYRENYTLYDGKSGSSVESEQLLARIRQEITDIQYQYV